MRNKFLTTALITVFSALPHTSMAETTTIASCSITGPGVAICAGIAVTAHELVQCGNGNKCFSKNGELYKVGDRIVTDLVEGNWAGGENSTVNQAHRDVKNGVNWLGDRTGLW